MGAVAGYNAYQRNRGMMKPRLRASMASRTKARRALYRVRRRRYGKKGWKKRAMRIYALPRNFTTCKTTETVLPNTRTINGQICDVQALVLINKGTAINQRARDQCYLAGIKINANFNNTRAARQWVNWAVVFPRNQATLTNGTNDFFRDYTSQRSWNANDATKSGLTWANAAINTDEFLVMARGKFLLSPGTLSIAGTFNKTDSSNDIERYIKIGRTITFDGPIEAVDQQCYFVTWVADPNANAGFDTGAGMTWRLRAICYFRDPKGA